MRRCKMCGRWDWIEKHHVFGGANRKNDLKLKQEYQKTFEQEHTREEFRKIFGRSYL